MKLYRYRSLALLLAVVFVFGASDALAQGKEFWADSIYSKATGDENSLQWYLDSLGYNIDVANDELGWEIFCGLDGLNTANLVIEVAQSSLYSTSGYYQSGDTSIFYQLFGPSDGPGDSVQFTFASFDSIGFFMKPNLPGNEQTWLTEIALNWDNFDHTWVFATGVPHEYLICWEDIPDGGDKDYQDLVIKVTFENYAPELTLPKDSTVILCSPDSICFDITAHDPNCEADSIWLEMIEGEGYFEPLAGLSTIYATHCFLPTGNGTYTFVFRAEDILGAVTIDTAVIHVTTGSVPQVELNDTTFTLCYPSELCIPVSIFDPDCDITSVVTNYGTYAGTMNNFDQVKRINDLGGAISQIGGGAPGKVLYTASDFIPPVNSQSGVSVALPNFVFADHVVNYGSFPSGPTHANSADQLLGPPTDLTFTSPGPGGPDGGNGSGSLKFKSNRWCIIGFPQDITTCHGANADISIFTGANCGAMAKLYFNYNGTTVYTTTLALPGGTAGSGDGGATIDLPDGLTFNELKIKNVGDIKYTEYLQIDAIATRTSPSPTSTDVCFYADTSGIYEIIVTATDSCGNVGADTALVTVNLNSPPFANAGSDFTAFLCDFSEVCFSVSFVDPDYNIKYTELYSGPGSLNGDQVCFIPTVEGTYTFVIHAVDSCYEEDFDTVVVTAETNDPPVADDPDTVTQFMCQAEELCHTFTASDPNGGPLTWTHLAGVGSITPDGQFCFTPTVSGTYSAAVIVADSCGAVDTTSITYDLTINSAPVAVDPPSPVDVFQCTAEEICYQFEASDADGNTLVWSKLSGNGTVTQNGLWCFTTTTSGSYSTSVAMTDSCGAADTTTLTYNVTLNDPPEIAFGNDTSVLLCSPQEICMSYTVSDPQGLSGITEIMISGYGTIDTAANEICFTPSAAGSYDFIVSIVDSCGALDKDTIVVEVSFGETASIDCPSDPINVSLCSADTVCQLLNITPDSATVNTSYGTYEDGQLCFYADTSGTYDITVIASTECGADTCELTFSVEIGSVAEISCPDPQDIFICEADTVCVPVSVLGTGVTVEITPIGIYSGGNVCFPADTSGHYEIQMIANTPCGSDTCLIIADITINSSPVAADPSSPVDTFICAADQICYQFTANDVDGGTLTWARLSGNGTVNASGQWCFDANTSGSYSVTAEVVDSCGASDTVALTYNLTINSAPNIALGNDTTIFVCSSGLICLTYTALDVDDNIDSIVLVAGDGDLDTALSQVCFTPSTEGMYEFIVKVIDACGVTDVDTINVTININEAPLVDAGSDQTIFQCDIAEICWPAGASDPDGNLASVELIIGPGTFNGTQICFTPTGTYNYEFVLKATDNCGVESYDTAAIYYTLNSTPVADAGEDQTLFLSEPTEICWPASCSDVDGNLTGCALVEGPGSYNGTNICFTPSVTGVYTFVIEATDACGATDRDTAVIDVTFNSPPVCVVPDDTAIFQCVPAEVCLPAYGTDDDGNLKFCQIISGPGSLVGGNWCYTPVSDQAVTVTMRCEDSCGAYCESQFTVEFDINSPPTIAFGNDTSIFLCESEEICLPYVASDPDAPRPDTIILVSGEGTLDDDSSWVCFTPTSNGTYSFVIRIQDECDEFNQDTINVDVTINNPPVADAGADQSISLCDSVSTVCWSAACSDVDGNLTDCLFNGPGTYDGSQICYNPVISGNYQFTLHAIDDCGEEMIDTVTISAMINSDPVISFGADTTLLLCAPQEICFTYAVTDADGLNGIIETMISGYGNIDTATNTICFTPTSDGSYEFIVSAEDSCLATSIDTMIVNVTFGDVASIDCPSGPVEKFLCGADSIIQALSITPVSASVSVSYGTYDDGAVRFYADTAGSYAITVIASDVCGADTCELVFNVTFNSPPVANAGNDQTVFQCTPAEICWAASCSDPDGNLSSCELVSGTGTYNGSAICFTPSASGNYEFLVKATDACGVIDYDTVNIDVTINSAPTVVAQDDTSLFLCGPQQICVSYTPDDADGLSGLTENMVSGYGSIDTANNQMCFTPTVSDNYEFIVRVTDPCGETDEDTMVVSVTFGEVATIDCPDDTIHVSLCDTATVCNLLYIQPSTATVVCSFGSYANGEHCFKADTSGIYVVEVIATESCGADTCQLIYKVDIGQAAEISCPDPRDIFVCEVGEEVCVPISVLTPGATITVTPIGYYNAGNVCFPIDTTGHYEIKIVASTACGSDSCVIVADALINSAPIADDPTSPVDTFLCEPDDICYQFAASDVDGGTLTWTKLSGMGAINAAGNWCFNAGSEGSWNITAVVTDSCEAADTVSLTYDIDMNSSPVVTLGNDTTVSLCDGDTYCFGYTVTDDDGNVTLEELVSGSGTIDTAANEVCFTPTSNGTYQFVIQATDSCGKVDADTIEITVDLGTSVTVTCPDDTAMFLCSAQEICRPVGVSISGASVVVTPIGYYDEVAGQVCFDADTAGHYVIQVAASSTCGSDTCKFIVDVTINSNPVTDDPTSPVDTFICASGQICYQFSASDVDGGTLEWSRISGDGTVSSNGLWCFTPSTRATSYTVSAKVADPCGAADTVTLTYNVTTNSPPTVAFGNDTTIFQCATTQVCFAYAVTDPDNNITLEELLTGAGTIDTAANEVCFTPDTIGTYGFIVKATDACGASGQDTINVTVGLNNPPVAAAGNDRNVFQCAPVEICWPASCTDPDGNLDSCYLTTSVGTYNGTNICFTPDTAGTYTFVLRAVDACGLFDEDTALVYLSLNSPPVCEVPNDTSFFQCTPTQVSLPVTATDVDNNFDHCEIITGPGSIVGGNWVYTPSADQTVIVKVMCLDACGATCEDSFTVVFEINTPPVVDVGPDTSYFFCQPGTTICWPVSIDDEDGNIETVELVSPNGYYDAGNKQICFAVPPGETGYMFVLKATDSCGAVDYDTTYVTISFNAPPTLDLPPDFTVYLDEPGDVCFDVNPEDEDGNLSSVTVSPIGSYDSGTEQVCFTADSSGEYCMVITATDACGAFVSDTVCLTLEIDECIHVMIEKTHNSIQGYLETVEIYLNGSGKPLGGFDLLITYDRSALNFQTVDPGSLFEQCDWEYFTHRTWFWPSYEPHFFWAGIVRVIALADLNNGAYHPGCFFDGKVGSLATLKFLVTDNRLFECQYVPIQFFWTDCGDNTFSSKEGDTLWISRSVYDFELNDITNFSYGFPSYFGAPDECLVGGGEGKPAPIRCADFTNGGVDIVCTDSIDARGDINLNGLPYEVADAVVFTNYFIYGLSAFTISVEGQTAATDANADGLTLTVGDLVYLIRVVIGDAPPASKPSPAESMKAEFAVANSVLSITKTDCPIGAVYLVLEGEVEPKLHEKAAKMEMRSNFDGTNTRVLIYNMNGKLFLEGGPILKLNGSPAVKTIEAGSFDGAVMVAKVSSLPDHFSLSQNYPNPFNPVTTIEFALPLACEWNLVIYNILGQEVESWTNTSEAGYMKIEWDAGKYASGVYFYRLHAGEFTATKKMLLLK